MVEKKSQGNNHGKLYLFNENSQTCTGEINKEALAAEAKNLNSFEAEENPISEIHDHNYEEEESDASETRRLVADIKQQQSLQNINDDNNKKRVCCKGKKEILTQKQKMEKIKETRKIKKEQLLYAPPFCLLMKISIPTVISHLLLAAYHIVDSICVAQFSGQTDAISAMSVFNPIDSGIIFSTVIGISTGNCNVISLALGREDMEETEALVTFLFFLSFIFSIFLPALLLPLLPTLLEWLGADEVTKPLALDYGYIAVGLCIGYIMSSTVGGSMRVMNSSVASMIRLICSSVLNALFDVLFMKGLGLGIRGAALATASATLIIMVSVFVYWCSPRTPMVARPFFKYIFNKKLIKKYGYLIGRILLNGLGAGIDPLLRSITGIIFNNTVKNYIPRDDPNFDARVRAAIGAMGTTLRVQQAINSAKGISQSWSGIAATAIGAKNYSRFVRVTWQAIVSMLVFGGALSCILTSLSPQLAGMFSDADNELEHKLFMEYAVPLLKYGTLSSVFSCHYTLTNALFQIIGKPASAFFTGIVSTLVYIPLMFIFPRYYGVPGYRFVILSSDIVSAFTSLTITIVYVLKFNRVVRNKGSRAWLDKMIKRDEEMRKKHAALAESRHNSKIIEEKKVIEEEIDNSVTEFIDLLDGESKEKAVAKETKE